MKIITISDTHLEYDTYIDGYLFIQSLESADAIVLAGDICNSKHKESFIGDFCDKYERVIYIPGNHEFWNSNPNYINENNLYLGNKYKNFHPLNRSSYKIGNTRFYGAVGWPYIPESYSFKVVDLQRMISPGNWINTESSKDWFWIEEQISFLNNSKTEENSIFVTHFVPTTSKINYKFLGNPGNWYFCLEKDYLVNKLPPNSYWICGHVHDPFTAKINNCKVICNPRGYLSERPNGFYNGVTIELG